jgi:hypothetical protein
VKKSLIALSLAAVAASALTVAPASAQDYGYDGGRDPCAQVQHDRGTSGAVLGALAGAALGSNLAAHHGGRSGGAILGALAGAAVGNNIGRSSGEGSQACVQRDERPVYYTETSASYGGYDRDVFRANDLNQREARLGAFIRRGGETGALSPRDGRYAWNTLRSIENQHRAFYDRDGGYLTERDRMIVRGRLNDLSRFVRSADVG